jgi:hypothetical protein
VIMSTRSRAHSENMVAGGGNPNMAGIKRVLGGPQPGRPALGNILNTKHPLVSTDEPSKEICKPVNFVKKNVKAVAPTLKQTEDESEKMEMSALLQDDGMEAAEAVQLEDVENIDAEDIDNPQLVTEYVNEIYSYLRSVESAQFVKTDYLEGQTEILPKMRAVLIDWLVGVHLQFHLLQETLYTTVAILDRFLQKDLSTITRKKLQLVGVTSMLIAAKYEEIYAPEVKDFVYITDRAYTEKEILKMEIRVLAVLNFDLGRPLPLHFLRRASKAGGVDAATHTLAKYIVELSLGVYSLCSVAPSKVAAAGLALAVRLLEPGSSFDTAWNSNLVHYTKYSMDELFPLVCSLAEALFIAPSAKLATVYTKYTNKKFMKISRIPVLDDPVLRKIAKGEKQ